VHRVHEVLNPIAINQSISDEKMIYTCLRYLWPCIRMEFIIQASKSLTVFPKQLRISPEGPISLKLL
jgi:hypothetical protein